MKAALQQEPRRLGQSGGGKRDQAAHLFGTKTRWQNRKSPAAEQLPGAHSGGIQITLHGWDLRRSLGWYVRALAANLVQSGELLILRRPARERREGWLLSAWVLLLLLPRDAKVDEL